MDTVDIVAEVMARVIILLRSHGHPTETASQQQVVRGKPSPTQQNLLEAYRNYDLNNVT